MRARLSLLSRLVVVATLAAPQTWASAACESNGSGTARERAKAHFQAGLAAYDAKRYSEAVDHLSCANQLLPNPAFTYNIAVTYEAMGDVPTALRWFREHRRLAGADADTDALNAKVAELEGKLQARGVQQVSVFSEPSAATLSIDDRPVGLTPLTLELNPGSHRFRLTLSGHEATEGSFELRIDRSLDVRAELPPEREPRSEPPALPGALPTASEPEAPGAEGSSASIGTWTWVSLGAGALLLGGALGFELRRAQADADLDGASQADYQARYDAMETQQTPARVLAGLGTAALIGGGVLLVLDLGRSETEPDVAVLGCGEQGMCFGASGAF